MMLSLHNNVPSEYFEENEIETFRPLCLNPFNELIIYWINLLYVQDDTYTLIVNDDEIVLLNDSVTIIGIDDIIEYCRSIKTHRFIELSFDVNGKKVHTCNGRYVVKVDVLKNIISDKFIKNLNMTFNAYSASIIGTHYWFHDNYSQICHYDHTYPFDVIVDYYLHGLSSRLDDRVKHLNWHNNSWKHKGRLSNVDILRW